MASGSYTGSYTNHFTLKSTWTSTSNIAGNYSNVTNNHYWICGQYGSLYINGRTNSCTVNGNTQSFNSPAISTSGGTTIHLGTTNHNNIAHNTDGTKSVSASTVFNLQATINTTYVSSVTASGTLKLDDIPRYATSVQTLSSKTETSISMDWSSDSTVDYVWYSTDWGTTWKEIGSVNGTSGSYTITEQSKDTSKLTANTTYNVITRVRRKDSQLTTNSSKLSVTTYDYPYATETPNFTVGNDLTIPLYNPLNRSVTLTMIGADGSTKDTGNYTGTSVKGFSVAGWQDFWYASIPNNTSGNYKVKVTYGSIEKTTTTSGKYNLDTSQCTPTFTNFTYKDTNTTVTGVTGNNQVLVKGLSTLQVTISSANKMVAQKGATPSKYIAVIDTLNKSVNYSTSGINLDVGTVVNSGTKRLTVTAYDSRTIPKAVYKDITVYDYAKPVVNASVSRLNNFEAETTLKVNGTYTRLTIDGSDKNTITSVQYRYREAGGTWSEWADLKTTVTSGKFTCTNAVISLDNSKSFELEIQATDKLDSGTATGEVGVGQAIFFISTNKKACYINGDKIIMYDKVDGTNNTIKLKDSTYWDISAIRKGAISLSALIAGYGETAKLVEGDYNDMCASRTGFYRCSSLTNAPYTQAGKTSTNNWFYLIHISHSVNYHLQIASPYYETGLYFRIKNAGTWSKWVELTTRSGTNTNGSYVKYPDGTMICRGRIVVPRKAGGGQSISVNLPAEFIDNDYDVSLGILVGGGYWSWLRYAVETRTTSSMTIQSWNDTTNIIEETTLSYIAMGKWK